MLTRIAINTTPNASIIRDWVIHAYNQNKSFMTSPKNRSPEISSQTPHLNKYWPQGSTESWNHNQRRSIVREYRTDMSDAYCSVDGLDRRMECHDHKYDPISQKSFINSAFFNLVQERGQSEFQPQMQINSPLATSRMQALTGRIQNLKQGYCGSGPWWARGLAKSIASSGNTWHVRNPLAKSSGGTTTSSRRSISVVSGENPQKDIYTNT